MKIATWNINGINGRLTNLLRWLEEAEPDVVCLQELKSFLLNEQLTERLVKGVLDADVRGWLHSTDHAPVWIELKD